MVFILYNITSSRTFYFFPLYSVIIVVIPPSDVTDVIVWPIITLILTLEFKK